MKITTGSVFPFLYISARFFKSFLAWISLNFLFLIVLSSAVRRLIKANSSLFSDEIVGNSFPTDVVADEPGEPDLRYLLQPIRSRRGCKAKNRNFLN